MQSIIRVIGNLLRLVGISSPEDVAPKPTELSDTPSWRANEKPPATSQQSSPNP